MNNIDGDVGWLPFRSAYLAVRGWGNPMTEEEVTVEQDPRVDPDTGRIDYEQDSWEEMQGIPPQYTLVPVPKRMNVDPGDTIKIDLFINGYGGIDYNKLQLNYPFPDFITDEEDKGEIKASIWSPEDNEDAHTLYSVEDPKVEHGISEWGVTTSVPPECFSPIEVDSHLYPVLASEITFSDCPLLSIELTSSEDADPGKYPVKTTFTYGDEENVFQDHRISVIHINNTREQHEPWVTVAGLFVVVIALVSLIIQAWNVLM